MFPNAKRIALLYFVDSACDVKLKIRHQIEPDLAENDRIVSRGGS